ncbi:MAG TPA: alkaline phosphatase family protein [Solirubrobacteraceae bacterium]|nr:alkaline phosphatase family protein [Solirubrobacteraceae bacterium]
MQENRSFDHYFGTLAGVRGFDDPNVLIQSGPSAVAGKSIFYQQDQYNPDGYLLPWHLDTLNTSSQAIPSTSHAWQYQHESLNIAVGNPTTAVNNEWIPSHYVADGSAHYWYVMGYYERQDIPFHFALAETFTLCDSYHRSLLGPTWPNRMYLMTGMIDPEGTGGGPVTTNVVPSPFNGKTPGRLNPSVSPRPGISWRVHQEEDDYGTNVLEFFEACCHGPPSRGRGSTGASARRCRARQAAWRRTARTVVVGIYPHGIAITPDGKTAYVANTGPNTGQGGSQTVSVVDAASQAETGTVTVGEAPQIVTLSPDGSSAFVTCADGCT